MRKYRIVGLRDYDGKTMFFPQRERRRWLNILGVLEWKFWNYSDFTPLPFNDIRRYPEMSLYTDAQELYFRTLEDAEEFINHKSKFNYEFVEIY